MRVYFAATDSVGSEGKFDLCQIFPTVMVMTPRIETIPIPNAILGEGERISTAEVQDGKVVVVVVDEIQEQTRRARAGADFFDYSKRMKEEFPINPDELDQTNDPRMRAILDDCKE